LINEITLIEPFFKGNALALIKGGKLQDFFADFEDSDHSLVGSTFVGEVVRFSKNSNSCFIKLPNNQVGFLRGSKDLKSGDKLLLQSRFFTPKNKALVVTRDLSFKGRYVIITPKKKMISFSKNISNKDQRQSLRDLGEKYPNIKNKMYGIIFRSTCRISSNERIKEDIEKQLARCNKITAVIPNDILFIESSPNALQNAFQEWQILENQDPKQERHCFDNFSIWEQLLSFRESSVQLPSGGSISIEPTQALVAIDVNTGSDTSLAAGLKANIEAMNEIPRQLRIRGLGGKIVVEMGPLSKIHRIKIESTLKKNVSLYSDKIRIAGWTPLGNLELEKSRDRRPIGETQFSQIEKII